LFRSHHADQGLVINQKNHMARFGLWKAFSL
jgi:hypothetical protein